MVITEDTQTNKGEERKILLNDSDFDAEEGVSKKSPVKTYSITAACAITINYVIGTGVLNLPHTIAQCSIIPSIILILLSCVVSAITAGWIVDAIARSYALKRDTDVPDYTIPVSEHMEISSLMGVLLGRKGFIFYQICVIIYFMSTLWGYASVVASSLASSIPFTFLSAYKDGDYEQWVCIDPCDTYYSYCNQSYWFWIAVALVFSVALVMVEITDQKHMQQVFTVMRWAVMLIIIIIVFRALWVAPYDPEAARPEPPYIWANTEWWHLTPYTVGLLFPAAAFSMLCHHSLGGVVRPVAARDKKHLGTMFWAVFAAICVFYLLLGGLSGLFFGYGNGSADLVTLNFATFDGTSWQSDTGTRPLWAVIISEFVIICPPIYVLSAVPLNAITLANNMLELLPESMRTNKAKIITRLLATIPPILVAGWFRCLQTIVSICGLTGFVLLVFAPAAMVLAGRKKSLKRWGPSFVETPHSSWHHHIAVVVAVLVFGTIGIVMTAYSICCDLWG